MREFHSEALERGCEQHGIKRDYRQRDHVDGPAASQPLMDQNDPGWRGAHKQVTAVGLLFDRSFLLILFRIGEHLALELG